jgi:hypothetical protein
MVGFQEGSLGAIEMVFIGVSEVRRFEGRRQGEVRRYGVRGLKVYKSGV